MPLICSCTGKCVLCKNKRSARIALRRKGMLLLVQLVEGGELK